MGGYGRIGRPVWAQEIRDIGIEQLDAKAGIEDFHDTKLALTMMLSI